MTRDLLKITPDVLQAWLEAHGWTKSGDYWERQPDRGYRYRVTVPEPSVSAIGDVLDEIACAHRTDGMDTWGDAYDAIVGRPTLTGRVDVAAINDALGRITTATFNLGNGECQFDGEREDRLNEIDAAVTDIYGAIAGRSGLTDQQARTLLAFAMSTFSETYWSAGWFGDLGTCIDDIAMDPDHFEEWSGYARELIALRDALGLTEWPTDADLPGWAT